MRPKILKSYFSVLTILLIFLCSCSSYKKIPYFQDLSTTTATQEQVNNYSPLIIQPADILAVNVNSRNPESSNIFNYNLNRVNGSNFDNSPGNPVTGYLVDADGNIQLPLIGSYKAAGLTTSQLGVKLRDKLVEYYKDPVVNVRMVNFKVAIFGDVQRPNVYTLQNERTTITQALSLAGDLNITALRNIFLIREQDGKRMYIPIDLTSKKLFDSPYYYIKNNDEIFVQADKTKYAAVNRNYPTWSLILSGLSIIAIVLSNIYRR
jgi:polysaccharide export outer membrane protein